MAEFGEDPHPRHAAVGIGLHRRGIGAAAAGMRPIVELMTVNFSLLALDQIMNTAATIRHMSGGQFGVPLVIRMATGAGKQLAAQHSHSLEGWYAHIPGPPRCWRRPRSRMRAACSGPRCRTPTRC
jgi:2-oxoisovalerate dehydrogenase E1 component